MKISTKRQPGESLRALAARHSTRIHQARGNIAHFVPSLDWCPAKQTYTTLTRRR